MKKRMSLLAMFLICLSIPLVCQAKSGDIAGVYYATDIRTSLNGYAIDSINIGGMTLISAEDMHFYSFDVVWSESERTLCISRAPHPVNGTPPAVQKFDLPAGRILGSYYETDIVTYLDGNAITAYNIGGRTYILAEEMRDFGYTVSWDAERRTLDILSADRAGYEYSVRLSQGNSTAKEGVGGFSISYTKDGHFGSGDADHLNASLCCSGTGYSITATFYQNEALFYSSELLGKLQSFVSGGYGAEVGATPEEKADLISQHMKISINGYPAQHIAVSGGAGNGHRDFQFTFDGIPLFRRDEINTIHISVDEDESAELYEIRFPVSEADTASAAFETLKKNPEDFMRGSYTFGDHLLINVCEIPSFGTVIERLYILRRADGAVLYDALEAVRGFDGYSFANLSVYDLKTDGQGNLLFACMSEQKNGNFSAEAETGKVWLLSEYDR